MKNIFKSVLSVILITELIIYPDTVIRSAADALNTCFGVLLPSLFPFFVLSRTFIGSGGAAIAGNIFNPLMRPLFRINGIGASAFILGIISGYPIGAKTAVDLYTHGEITKKEAENLVCFCNNSGPLFIIGALGTGMLSSKDAGIFLYIVHILSAITLGVILKFTLPANPSANIKGKIPIAQDNIFTTAVESSMISVINVFAYVIFFAIMMDICKISNIFVPIEKLCSGFVKDTINPIIYSIFEMTSGIKKLSTTGCVLSIKLILSSFMLGWSGLSIHFQTKSILSKTDISFSKYILAKLFHGVLAAIYTYIGINIVPFDTETFSNSSVKIPSDINAHFYLLAITVLIGVAYITALHHSGCNIRYSKPKQRTTR